jgi:hypothetical protein
VSELPLFDRIRAACEEVAHRARHVAVDDEGLENLAGLPARERPKPPDTDPAHRAFADAATTTAFIITMNAINFGSGWFPHLQKRGGNSGYLTLASALRERFDREGPLSARELETITPEGCAALLGQSLEPPVDELMQHFARSWNELGAFLAREHRGRFQGPVEQAAGSAASLVATLARMPLYRDVSQYQGFEVPFYKRAQITASDLAQAFGGRGLGRFEDIDRLTIFADNLVPHVLRMLEVLHFDEALEARIDAGELLENSSEEEVEIRAVALYAVERLGASCTRRGWPVNAARLDHLLWSRGQSPLIKARPRHRTRCTFY